MIIAGKLSVCVDCEAYLANGEAERVAAIVAGIEREGGHVVLDGEALGFSWSPCELCLDDMAGNRAGAAVLMAERVA